MKDAFTFAGWITAAAFLIFAVGLTAGDNTRERVIQENCDVSGFTVINGKAYRCVPLSSRE